MWVGGGLVVVVCVWLFGGWGVGVVLVVWGGWCVWVVCVGWVGWWGWWGWLVGVVGWFVKGRGGMGDSDLGYVGGDPGKINLYVGKERVKVNFPEAGAVLRLTDLVSEHGKRIETPASRVEI